ncbi:sodium/potassium-transporting ATPase subunit beta-like protein [Dinothrombium tinctorium]|uniref:Sodium/potassium-transporting ATPase subunit beta-like protein n=1 Tax=Dinothrombium tinctorium TaxID=1965070 RepID=A0A3S3RQ85_9ACAR|nr:sodium/potassium-transporting ATPase subunit beta-like protein [Dinothrombium tinctorium]
MSSKKPFLNFVYNKNTGQFCGRTPGSWAKIILFYIIFYSCLATFWAIMLLLFYAKVDYNEPKWQLAHSLIGTNPGLSFRPRAPASEFDMSLIWFSSSAPKSYEKQVKEILRFIEEENRPLSANYYKIGENTSCLFDEPQKQPEQFCLFEMAEIPEEMNCLFNENESFGYNKGTPCVIFKLNRIFGWIPESYNQTQINEMKKKFPKFFENLKEGHIYITCEGENAVDVENIKKVTVHPKEGISFKYFPFRNRPGYVSPYVFVQFEVRHGVLINIECKAWANNIKQERIDREGSVRFQILVD